MPQSLDAIHINVSKDVFLGTHLFSYLGPNLWDIYRFVYNKFPFQGTLTIHSKVLMINYLHRQNRSITSSVHEHFPLTFAPNYH